MDLNHEKMLRSVAGLMDMTLLSPQSTRAEHLTLCREALRHGAKGVCVSSSWLPFVAKELLHSPVLPISVIGFPLGTGATESKVMEARWCESQGARELDMVVHLGFLKSGEWQEVADDLSEVVGATSLPVKVIFEAHCLTPSEVIQLCSLCTEAGAKFVKTSTGFGGGEARVNDVQLMSQHFKGGVKASGGIRTFEVMKSFVEAGATRIGTSSGSKIIDELSKSLQVDDSVHREWLTQSPFLRSSL